MAREWNGKKRHIDVSFTADANETCTAGWWMVRWAHAVPYNMPPTQWENRVFPCTKTQQIYDMIWYVPKVCTECLHLHVSMSRMSRSRQWTQCYCDCSLPMCLGSVPVVTDRCMPRSMDMLLVTCFITIAGLRCDALSSFRIYRCQMQCMWLLTRVVVAPAVRVTAVTTCLPATNIQYSCTSNIDAKAITL